MVESGSGGMAIELRVGTSKGLLSPALSSNPDRIGTGIGEGEDSAISVARLLDSMAVGSGGVVDWGEAEGLSGWPGPF